MKRTWLAVAALCFSAGAFGGDAPEAHHYTVKRSEIIDCVSSASECFKKILASPYKVDGKLQGWTLSKIVRKSIFEKLGFKEGDILVSANDEGVTSTSSIPIWLFRITRVKEMRLGLIRKGRPARLEYTVTD